MKKGLFQGLGVLLLLYGIGGLVAPHISAAAYGTRLRRSLERSLGRQVEIRGNVGYSLFAGPGLSAEQVVIHEDPSIGFEPIAYVDSVDVRPSLWSLLTGRFVIASIRLDGATINLAKSGPASESGRWNFASFINRSVMSTAPAIHVRDGRINFKFGDTKSIFYLMDTDLDISPPGSLGGGWHVSCEADAARTDRQALTLGAFTLKGEWYVAPERVDLDLQLRQTGLGELTALMRGSSGGIHGTISSRLHLAGPIDRIGILGRLTVEDVHRWDLLPPKGEGWPLDIRGRLDLVGQQLELQSTSSVLPITARFRANDYLSKPRWAVTVNWNQFPAGPVLQLARHMGAQLPPKLQLSGTIDGAIGYSGEGSFQGQLALHNTAVAIPDSPAMRFDKAYVIFERGHVRLSPAMVHTAQQDEAWVAADYSAGDDSLDLSIVTDAMKVESLRSQVSLAAVPWLDRLISGHWSGQLKYHRAAGDSAWSGALQVADAQVAVPGLADPLRIESARVQISGDRVAMDHLQAQAGKIEFTGDYRYLPGAARPHRLRVHADQVDAQDLETELMPTLRRGSLLERALGRSTVPDWLRGRDLDGTVQIGSLQIGDFELRNFRARILWDATRVELDGLAAKFGTAAIGGSLAANLRGPRPAYTLTAAVLGLPWQSGKVRAEGTLETAGTGEELLSNLKSEGTFSGAGLDFGALAPSRAASGSYSLSWSPGAPRLTLTDLHLRTEDETYIGRGATQDDGRLLIQLSNGAREMRMSGSLASLKVDAPARP